MSQLRPVTYGPRSITGTVTVLPFAGLRNVTRVPHGSVRLATPRTVVVSATPQAVRFPYIPGPYQLTSGSKCHAPTGAALVTDRGAGVGAAVGAGRGVGVGVGSTTGATVGWGATGRASLTAEGTPDSDKGVSGPSHPAERCARSSVGVVVTSGPDDGAIAKARNSAGSIDAMGLEG